MPSPLKLDERADALGLWEKRDLLEQYAVDAVTAYTDGRGVKVSQKVRVRRWDGRGPYTLDPGDTLHVVEITGSMRLMVVSNDKDETILKQVRRIAELEAEIVELRRQLKEQ